MAESPNGLKGLVEPTELVAWLREHLPATGRLVSDSRRVGKGDAFFALHGRRQDGSTFIAQAVQQGAAAVVMAIPAQACQARGPASRVFFLAFSARLHRPRRLCTETVDNFVEKPVQTLRRTCKTRVFADCTAKRQKI